MHVLVAARPLPTPGRSQRRGRSRCPASWCMMPPLPTRCVVLTWGVLLGHASLSRGGGEGVGVGMSPGTCTADPEAGLPWGRGASVFLGRADV